MKNIVNRALVAKKKQFQSKSVPRGTRTIWRYLGALFLLFTFAIGNVLAEGTTAKVIATGDQYFSAYTEAKTNLSSNNWVSTSGSPGNSGSSYTAPSGWLDGGSGKPGYGMMNVQSGKTVIFTVTNITGVSILGCSNNTSSRTINLSVKTGDVEVGTVATKTTSSTSTPEVLTYGSTLDKTKTYTVTVSASSGNNAKFMQIKFVGAAAGGGCTANPAAPTKFEAGSIIENGVTFSITDAANAGKYDIYYSTSSTAPEATTAASATSTAKTKAITGLTASTRYYAWVRSVCDDSHKSAWVALTGGFFTTAAPDPCHRYFWFSKAADATTAGVTNNEGGFFTTSASGSNGTTSSITIDEVEYAITNRTGNIGADDATIVSFTIPANKAGVLYVNMASSGNKGESSNRTLYLKKGGVTIVTATNAIYGDGAQHNATIENIPSGTYTLHANNNVKVGMFAVKACDATYHTIALDLDGGTGATSIAAIDGVPAYKPADPTKDNADFVKWVVKSSGADYAWTTNVTGDLTLKAVWAEWPTLTLAAGEGATGTPVATQYKAGTEITVPEKPEGFSKGTDVFTGWAYSQTVTVTDGKFDMPATNLTLTAQWQAPSNFDVKFYQGYGEPDTQIGETQNIATSAYATAPTSDPTREGYRFLGWSYDATTAHIVNVAEYAILATTNFTAMWQKVWTVSFDGANETTVDDGKKVSSPNSPITAGKVFQGWYNGESKYDFSAAVTGNLALISKWADANANHFYYNYKDDFHFDGLVYKTPEGKTTNPEADEATLNLTTPYILFSGAEGIEEIKVTNGIYDYKKAADTKHVTSYIKINTGGSSKIEFTIAAGYTAVLKMKMGGYSSDPTITLQKGDDVVAATSGEPGGKKASVENNFNEIVYDLEAGTYTMTTATKTLYISHIDLEATELPKYSVTYNAGTGAVKDGESMPTQADAYEGQVITLASGDALEKAGHIFAGWVATYNDGEEKTLTITDGKITMPAYAVTVTAQWEDVSKVCKIGDVKYESLETALEHAADGTIELLQDIDVTAQVEILAGVTATIDLAGHKIEYTSTTTLTSGVILVHNGASLTINDSSDPDAGSIVSGEKAYAAIALTKAGDDAANPATLVVNGGALTGYYYGITGNGSRNNTDITINGGTITGTVGIAIYHPQVGTLTVNDGSLTGVDAAIEMRAGTLVINDGTFTATATEFSCNPNSSGSTTSGAAIAIAQHTTKKDISVTINGGTFNGVKALNESNPQVNDPAPQVTMAVKDGDFTGEVSTVDVNHFISGGTFKFEVLNDQCAPNFVPSPADPVTGKYTVEPKDATSLIKAVATATSQDITGENLTGIYKGAAHISASGSYKFNQGNYFMVQLKDGENFQAGDIVKINVASVNDCNGFALYSADEFTSANLIIDTHENSDAKAKVSTGINEVELPNTYAGSNKLYVARCSDCDKYLNAGINQVEVTRVVYPELKAITIDGRDGVINEAAKTVAVTIPYEAVLANLTIDQTIVRNAPHATTPEAVISNEGAWVIGANTYRVMDKDGDYSDYIITLTRDVLKHTVSFNTHGGSAVASVEVVDGQKLAAAPADPTKEDYLFQYWSLTDGGAEVDITTVKIDEDKEFHAVWASEGAIKLFDGEGNLNTTNFISPAKTTIEIADVEHVCLAEFTSNRSSSLAGAIPTEMVKYDATTDEAKIKITFYNSNSGIKKAVLYKFEEGAEAPEKIEIEVPGQQIWTTEYYTFNSSKNRSFYVCMNDRSYIRVLQVKVVDNGANPVKQFGQVGYSLNLNKGRFYAKDNVEKSFEGFTFTPSSEYKVYNNGNLQTKIASSFNVPAPAVLSVKRSGGKYYVYQDPADKGTLYSADAEIELNTTGTWYISSETTSSAVSLTKIEFLAPKCQKPVFGTMSDIDLCAGDAFTAIDGTATVSDGGVVSYKWYKEGSETVLGTAATYTPSDDGNYYVVATNSLADHQDNSATSDVVTVEHFDAAAIVTAPEDIATQAGQEKTLTIVASGANLQYVWYTCDDAEGTNPVAIVPAQTTASLTVTVPDGVQYYKVAVTDDCGADLSAVVKVEGWTDLPQVDVTASTVWDMTNVSANAINLKDDYNPSKQNVRLLLANIEGVNNNASFNSQALMFEGQHIGRTGAGIKHLAGRYVQFNVTVPGAVFVTFESNGDNARTISINGKKCARTTSGTAADKYITYALAVEPGSVEIIGYEGENANQYIRISKIEFKAEYSYHRENLNPSYLGTLCWTNNAVLGGGTLYEFAGKNEYNYLVFDEVDENRLEAGKPYIFMPENGNTEIKVYNTDSEEPMTEGDLQPVNHMYGTITGKTLVPGQNDNMYYFSASHIWAVKDFTVSINIPANCCYVDYVAVLNDSPAPAPAPGRRRVAMGVQGTQVATGMENLNVSDKPVKMIINGQLFILRGEKMYDAKGQLVK